MNVDDIERLVRLVADTDLTEVDIRRGGVRLRIARTAPPAPSAAPLPQAGAPQSHAPAPPAGAAVPGIPEADPDEGLHVITASMVGTFYRRPNPEAPPFVKEGDTVRKGQVLCILEAMKILNEIEADVSGTIVRVYAEDAQPVEYGERLMAVRAD